MTSLNRACFLSLLLFAGVVHSEDLSVCRRGWDATQNGDHATAVELFNSCIRNGNLSTASLARTHRNIGIAYRRAKEPMKAIESFNKAIALRPSDVWDDYVNRGNAYDDANDLNHALADYDQALKLKPDYGEAFYNRGIAFERHKMFEKAKADFMRAYEVGLRTELLYERFVAYGLVEKKQ